MKPDIETNCVTRRATLRVAADSSPAALHVAEVTPPTDWKGIRWFFHDQVLSRPTPGTDNILQQQHHTVYFAVNDCRMNQFPKRRRIRLQGFDYGSDHAYFITICTHRKRHLFGEIRSGIICLNELGALVYREWEQTFRMRPHYLEHAFQIMPNHLHGLIRITRPIEDNWNEERVAAFGRHVQDTLSTMVGGFKAAVTKFARNTLGIKEPIWQVRFHDHVVRDWKEFEKIRRYICSNTRRWRDDSFYSAA